MTSKKIVIVNADDFGMSLEVSKGILEAAGFGIVKATTAMTNLPDFEPSMGLLKNSQHKLDIGFHANLTCGRPINDPNLLTTIVDKNGQFFSKNGLLGRTILSKISAHEVYVELRSQLERLRAKIGSISHIDGHHHVHIFPVVCDVVARLAKEFDIRFVRAPVEGLWPPSYFLKSSQRKFWRRKGFQTTDHFLGYKLGSDPDALVPATALGARGASKNLLERWLKTISIIKDGTTEIMVHPGYPSEENGTYNEGREQELGVLKDPRLMEVAGNCNVKFADFHL